MVEVNNYPSWYWPVVTNWYIGSWINISFNDPYTEINSNTMNNIYIVELVVWFIFIFSFVVIKWLKN